MGFLRATGSILAKNREINMEAEGLVANVTKQQISSNGAQGENFMGNMSNSHALNTLNDVLGIQKPSSTIPLKKGQAGPAQAREFQEGVQNRYANHRGALRQGRDQADATIARLQEQKVGAQNAYKTSGQEWTEDMSKVYDKQIAGAYGDKTSLGVQTLLSYPQQAGAHVWRALKATQEGPMKDRVIKTAGAAAVWGGANAGMRGLSGGGVTYNNDGERDIAGIPFL